MSWATDLHRSYSDPLRAVFGQRLNDSFVAAGEKLSYTPTVEGFSTADYRFDTAHFQIVGQWATVTVQLVDSANSVLSSTAELKIGIPAAVAARKPLAAAGWCRFRTTNANQWAYGKAWLGPDSTIRVVTHPTSQDPAWVSDTDRLSITLRLFLTADVDAVPFGPSRPDALPELWAPPTEGTVTTGTASSPPSVDVGLPNRNRVVFVATSILDATAAEDLTGVTVGGVAATLVGRAANSGGEGIAVELWYADEDALGDLTGSKAVAVTGPATPANMAVSTWCAAGLAQDGPTDSDTDTTDATGDPSVTLDTVGGGLVVMASSYEIPTGFDAHPDAPLVALSQSWGVTAPLAVLAGFEPVARSAAAVGVSYGTLEELVTTTKVFDSFTVGSDTALASHTPDTDVVGTGWAVGPSSGFTVRATPDNCDALTTAFGAHTHIDVGDEDHLVEVVHADWRATGGVGLGVNVRNDGSNNYLYVGTDVNTGGIVGVYTSNGTSAPVAVGTIAVATPPTINAGVPIRWLVLAYHDRIFWQLPDDETDVVYSLPLTGATATAYGAGCGHTRCGVVHQRVTNENHDDFYGKVPLE